MIRSLVAIAGSFLLAGCAASGGPVSGSSPQTTAISMGGDARTGAGSTTIVTSNRDVRGSSHRVEAMVDEVWRVLPVVYQELGITVGTVNQQTRTMGNTQLELSRTFAGERLSRLLSCGSSASGQPIADSYRVEASLTTILHPQPDGTTGVESRLTGRASNRATSGAPITCGTTGRLEERIARQVALRLSL